MKSKKLMGLFLAAAVATGAVAAGTQAWFTDSVTTDANLTVSMGVLDIALEELEEDEQWWVKVGTETDEETGDVEYPNGTDYFSNVRPGDTFIRTIPVRNEGTLTAKVDISLADLSAVVVGQDVNGNNLLFNDVFELVTEGTGTVEIKKGELQEVNLELKIKEDLGNVANANNGSEAMILFDLNEALNTEFVVVTANQLNK